MVSFSGFIRLATLNSQSSQSQRMEVQPGIYKLHSLGDYVQAIQAFGTTDSYSMQMVSVFKNHE